MLVGPRTRRIEAVYEATLSMCQCGGADYVARRLKAALEDWSMAPTDPVTVAVIEACIENAQDALYRLPLDSMFRDGYSAVINTATAAGYP